MAHLDELDTALLRELQRDARRTNRDLAEAIGVAPSTALDRTRSLRQRGVIRGALLDVDLAGSDEHALVPIRVAEVDRDRRIVRVDSADLRRTSAEAAAEGADELPVPPAITPAEVERRAEIVTGKDETTLERENRRDYEEEKRLEASSEQAPLTDYERDRARNREAVAKAERRAEENRVRYGQSKEIVIEQRPVVVEETIVRRRALDGSDAAADETLKRRKDDEIDRPEDRI